MFIIIVLVLLTVAGLLGLIFPVHFEADGEAKKTRAAGVVALIIMGIVLVFSSWTIVQPKNIGVVTTLGSVSDRTLDPGFAFILPWQNVTDLDGTMQPDEYRGQSAEHPCSSPDSGDDHVHGPLVVRIGDGSQSCVFATIRWQINPDKANVIFGNYRSDDPTQTLYKAVVSTQFKAALQDALAQYNPVASLKVASPGNNAQAVADLNFNPDYDQLGDTLTDAMKVRVNDLVLIDKITVSYVSLADSTQKTINDYIKAVGETRIAAQRRSTATEEAAANNTLAASISKEPGVLISKCLDMVASGKVNLPQNFQCFGGGAQAVFPIK